MQNVLVFKTVCCNKINKYTVLGTLFVVVGVIALTCTQENSVGIL